MANRYLMKFKGKYRILPELDKVTHDFPRDKSGEIVEEYNDLYISCQHGNKIYVYGHKDGNGKVVWLTAYIPSLRRGRNIKEELDKKNAEYTDYFESDSEVTFDFKAKDVDMIAELLKAKVNGANISPFSVKNLPKSNLTLPNELMEEYKEISAIVQKNDILVLHKITTEFLASKLEKKYKAFDKKFNYKTDMKKNLLSRDPKTYIWTNILII